MSKTTAPFSYWYYRRSKPSHLVAANVICSVFITILLHFNFKGLCVSSLRASKMIWNHLQVQKENKRHAERVYYKEKDKVDRWEAPGRQTALDGGHDLINDWGVMYPSTDTWHPHGKKIHQCKSSSVAVVQRKTLTLAKSHTNTWPSPFFLP